ncbi:MAG: Ig-like domain-containing protein, partial [Armatimonadetes bacterium]|nr:Ig-like domain-containing protein [Armatimonadota bacterium]
YDVDFYINAGQHPQPPLFECSMMGPYSVMAHGGRRVDAWHKIMVGWITPIAVTEDIIHAPVPEIEGTLENPVVYKLPGRPHYIHDGIPPDQWQEYFLVENRNRNGTNYFGDISARGLYIYHVDMRFGQTDEWHPMVIIEQADGLFELESNPDGQWGDTDADPFPGSLNVRNWTQLTMPNSYSHGWVDGSINSVKGGTSKGVLQPGTSTDSFARVANITDPGATMYANLHVVPREVIVTGFEPPGKPASAPQGALDVPMLGLHLDNDSNDPNLSMGDVELDQIRIDENGSSQEDADVVRASLFDDTDGDGMLDPAVDTRLATAVFQNQTAYFTNLHYPIPLDETRDLFIAYDINTGATAGPGVSLGVGLATFDYVRPEIPGAVQRRVRTARTASSAGLGSYRFPINAQLVPIDEAPDTLTVTPVSRAPVTSVKAEEKAINPGDVDVPILSLNLSVDMDTVEIDRVTVDEVGTINAVSNITSCKLYHDLNADGVVDGGDVLLSETSFANVGGVEKASFDISQNAVLVTDANDESLLLTCSISDQTPLPSTLQLRLEDPSYIHLVDARDIVSPENFPMESEEVSTPLPNDPPPAPTNLTATAGADGSITLNWTMSDDDPNKAGENDVTEYHIYRSTDPALLPLMTEANVYAIVQAGVTEYVDVNAPLGTPLYYMMRAYDGVQEGPDSNIAGPVTAADSLPPVFSAFDPSDNEENVSRATNITFTIDDAGSGIDMSTLVFEVDGVDVANSPDTTATGSPSRQVVVYDPPQDFDYLQTVQVRVQVADLAGNVAPGAGLFTTYQFTTEGPDTFHIAGTITDGDGVPEAGVRVEAGALWDISAADGTYEITGLAAGTYQVIPTKDGRSFTPASRSVTVGPTALGINFTSAPGYDISGIAQMAGTGAPMAGVTVSDGLHSDVTGADGLWALEDVPAGTYTVSATLPGYQITPPSIDVTVNATTGSVAGLIFEASLQTYDITGT